MKKLIFLWIFCSLLLSACLDSETKTLINADGSGNMTSTVDLSELLKMMAANEKEGGNFVMDTTINIKSYSDTSTKMSAYHKALVREMKIKLLMDMRDLSKLKFKVTIDAPFKSLDDFNALNELLKNNDFDEIFDNAMSNPFLSGEKDEDATSKPGDNLFGSVFPAFYNCKYTKNSIICKTDSVKYKQAVADLTSMDFNMNGEMESKMLEGAVFTNTLVLPRSVKKITGDSWKKTTEKELVQTGNYLDLYKNPGKYEYSIQY